MHRLAWDMLALLLVCGCSINDAPRPRLGSYATSTPGTRFIDMTNLGKHKYYSLFENNGIVYTREGGHIDIAHLRIGADYVRYLCKRTQRSLLAMDRQFSFKLNVEPSRYYVTWTYPEGWESRSGAEQERVAGEVALELAQYFAFTMVTWHEVLTYFGYKSMGIIPEFPSAFSWEDSYSNLLGIRLGAAAIRDNEQDYDTAMTRLIKAEMESLGIQPAATAKAAAERMRGVWFEGNIFVTMKVRNMDIGLGDGLVSPLLVPGLFKGAQPRSYPAPTLASFENHGFAMTLHVEPHEFEKGNIFKVVCPQGACSRVRLPAALPVLMDYLKTQSRIYGCELAGESGTLEAGG